MPRTFVVTIASTLGLAPRLVRVSVLMQHFDFLDIASAMAVKVTLADTLLLAAISRPGIEAQFVRFAQG